MILNFNCDVLLTYSPIDEATGHLYEVADYYLALKDAGVDAKILLMTKLPKSQIESSLRSKYDFQSDRWEKFLEDSTIVANHEQVKIVINSGHLLLTDGNILSLKSRGMQISAKRKFGFLCGNYDFKDLASSPIYGDITFLQDYRIYGRNPHFNCVDYVKKLSFKHYRSDVTGEPGTALLYLTSNCRSMSMENIEELIDYYSYDKYLILTPDEELKFRLSGNPKVTCKTPPIEDLFSSFQDYIYTPVPRMFDCSPRLPVECKFYGKGVIYHNINYHDAGLEVRRADIDTNFQNLHLSSDDPILNMLR